MKRFLIIFLLVIVLSLFFFFECKPDDSGDSGDGGDGGNTESWKEYIYQSPGNAGDSFGWGVAASYNGNALVVGARDDNQYGEFSGATYIYKWNGESYSHTKITAYDADEWSKFGSGLSISDDTNVVAIGAMWDTAYGGTGSAYIYKWLGTSWSGIKIKPSDADGLDYFGKSLSLSGDGNTLLVGAWGDDEPNGETITPESGSAYIFKKSGANWLETKIRPADGGKKNAFFGGNVDISNDGNAFIVGSYGYCYVGEGAWDGIAYAYRWNSTSSSWNEYVIEASDMLYHDDWFGYSVSISGDGSVIVVGSPNNMSKGATYIYKWNGSTYVESKLTASDGNVNDFFGCSVSISDDGNTIIVGASDEYAFAGTETSGSVYIYKFNGSSWVETKLVGTGIPNGACFGEDIAISGNGNVFIVGVRKLRTIFIYRWE